MAGLARLTMCGGVKESTSLFRTSRHRALSHHGRPTATLPNKPKLAVWYGEIALTNGPRVESSAFKTNFSKPRVRPREGATPRWDSTAHGLPCGGAPPHLPSQPTTTSHIRNEAVHHGNQNVRLNAGNIVKYFVIVVRRKGSGKTPRRGNIISTASLLR